MAKNIMLLRVAQVGQVVVNLMQQAFNKALQPTSGNCHLLCKRPHKRRQLPPAAERGVMLPVDKKYRRCLQEIFRTGLASSIELRGRSGIKQFRS
ncbi:hypothetical protein Maes01_02780 [Microbulbifer aestuariivivens]|uniref:Uncharacterized protein n=1 Tax=Microbulbifer aestuariivivens TaxID=1908308 RepID=A0ABP9WSW5_9GAMM